MQTRPCISARSPRFGVLAYALGQALPHRARRLLGRPGATSSSASAGLTLFTLLFATSELPLFTLAWIGNRLTQSIGWAGLIKVSSKWFDFSSYGTIIGILSISYLVG